MEEDVKWQFEKKMRRQALALELRKLKIQERDYKLKEAEASKAAWRNPLIIAILAAAVAAAGNAAVAVVNGSQNRALEDKKSEQARILEMIKTGDPDKAAENLQFLLASGLLADPTLRLDITEYLSDRAPGTGAVLASTSPIMGGIVGQDERTRVLQTLEAPYSSVCLVEGDGFLSSGALIAPQLVVTANWRTDVPPEKIACGADGDTRPLGTFSPDRYVHREVVISNPKPWKYNLTFIRLPEQAAGLLSSFVMHGQDDSLELEVAVSVAGYAADFSGGMFEASGVLLARDETALFHDIDTGFGAGGAPIFIRQEDRFVLVGVHIGTGVRKVAARISHEMVNMAQADLLLR